MLKESLFALAISLLIVANSGSSVFPEQFDNIPNSARLTQEKEEWTRSHKEDGIETFYKAEKIGTDRFEVRARVYNTRPRAIRVRIRLEYKSDFNPPYIPSPRFSTGQCQLVIPANSTRVCEPIKVTAKKVTGVKIIRWDNTDEVENK